MKKAYCSGVITNLLPEGVYLATSDTRHGLLAQGRAIFEVLDIARDVANMIF